MTGFIVLLSKVLQLRHSLHAMGKQAYKKAMLHGSFAADAPFLVLLESRHTIG